MNKLAINGAKPVRRKSFPEWPMHNKNEIKALAQVVKSGKWCRTEYLINGETGKIAFFNGHKGSKVREFEEKFSIFHNAKYGIATSSGTGALEIAVKACGINKNDEVIISPYTFISTATSVLQNNAIPIFVDIEQDTYNINPNKIEEAITEKTKAIIPVHFGGNPADMDHIMTIAKKYNLMVIEDAAQAHGAEWKNKKVGAIGNLGIFSFQQSKNMTAGEGGIILTNDNKLAELAFSYHLIGRKDGGYWYEHPHLGWNYRMTEFQGAILLIQLQRLEEQNKQRRINANYLNNEINKIEGLKTLNINSSINKSNYHIYIFKYSSNSFKGVPRERFIDALKAEGIPCSAGYTFPIYKNKFFSEISFKRKLKIDYNKFERKCPVAQKACTEEAIWLKHNLLLGTRKDMDDIITALRKVKDNIDELII